MSFLASLAKTAKQAEASPRPSLVPYVDSYLMLREEQDRRDGKFHPSDLSYDFCPRAWALYNYHPRGKDLKDQSWGSQMKRVLDNGTSFHERTQRYFHHLDLLWGRWRRPVEYADGIVSRYEVHVGWAPRTPGGEIDRTWEYDEVRLRNPERNVIGHTDGQMRLEGFSAHGFKYGKWGLELKSINSRSAGWLKEDPKTSHRDQTFIYADCLEWERNQGEQDIWYGAEGYDFWQQPLEGFIILYEVKDTQEYLEYVIPFDRGVVDGYFDSMRARMDAALAYKAAMEAGKQTHYPFCMCTKNPVNVLCKAFKVG